MTEAMLCKSKDHRAGDGLYCLVLIFTDRMERRMGFGSIVLFPEAEAIVTFFIMSNYNGLG